MAHKEMKGNMGLENTGWSAMQDILNVEMPVKKKKKRGVIYWWIGSAAAAILLIALPILNNTSPQENQVTTNQSNPIVDPQQDKSVVSPIKTLDAEEENENIISKINNENIDVAESTTPLASVKNESKSKAFEEVLFTTLKNDKQASVAISTDKANRNIQLTTSEFLISDKSGFTNSKNKFPNRIAIASINNIGILNLDPFVIKNKYPNAPKVKLTKPSKWGNQIELSTILSSINSYSAFNFGINKIYTVDHKWKLNMGLGYTFRPNATREKTDDELLASTVTPNQGSASMDLDFSINSYSKQAIHTINLNTGTSYGLNDRMSAYLGISLNYLAISNEKLYNINEQNAFQSFSIASPVDQSKLLCYTDIGLAYQINERLSLAGKYNILLNNQENLNKGIPDLFTDEFSISLQYMLD